MKDGAAFLWHFWKAVFALLNRPSLGVLDCVHHNFWQVIRELDNINRGFGALPVRLKDEADRSGLERQERGSCQVLLGLFGQRSFKLEILKEQRDSRELRWALI